jgi:hypothetical protein
MLLFAFAGCGGGSGISSSDIVSISGKAIDPYLSGSKVYLDLNENRKFDSNEPHTVTDKNGNYTLDIPKEYHDGYHTLVASDGTDTGTQKPFKGILTAVKEANETTYNITPLTSVVEARYRYYKDINDTQGHSIDEIRDEVASYLELDKNHIDADIVALADKGEYEPLKTALALETSAEYHDSEHPYKFYENITEEDFLNSSGWRENLKRSDPQSYAIVDHIMNVDTNDQKANDFAKHINDEVEQEIDVSKVLPFSR